MTIRKSNPYMALVNSYLIDSPQPSSINYWWNVGSLLGLCLVIQIASGLFLAMHYSSNIELAFSSVEHIMRECALVSIVKSVLSNTPIILILFIYINIYIIQIIATKYHDNSQSNKRIVWIAIWKRNWKVHAEMNNNQFLWKCLWLR